MSQPPKTYATWRLSSAFLALEEARRQVGLEDLDLVAYGRRGDVQLFGGAADAQQARDDSERADAR